MERKIRIFIAGAKELKQERNCIKVLANDLSSKYESRGIQIIAHSYEHFDDNQKSYNDYIEKEADIVIFILKGRIGARTEEEFLKATDSFRKENRPEIILFVHEYTNEELTSDIGRIQGLIAGRLGDKYHIDYSSLDDLRNKARERIERIIDKKEHSFQKSGSNSPITHKKTFASSIFSWGQKHKKLIFGILAGIVILLGGGILRLYQANNKPIVIFAGGGSVVNFIKDQTNDTIDLRSSDYIYMNLASGTSWSLLAEEANRYKNNEGQRRLISICLSADAIDASFFNEKTKDSFTDARIVGYYLGSDPLVVYLSKDFPIKKYISNDSSISPVELAKIIKDSDKGLFRLFTTSQTSGTLRLYQKCLPHDEDIKLDDMLSSEKSYLFYQDSRIDYINTLNRLNAKLPYAILGSRHYTVNDINKEGLCSQLYVKNDSGLIAKPMFIYFVASINGSSLNIQKPIIDFLTSIKAPKYVNDSIWKDITEGHFSVGESTQIRYINKDF